MNKALEIIERLLRAGAKECLFVGGYVRDKQMDLRSKDIDIEVYGLSYDQIVAALQDHYSTKIVGKAFGIVSVDNRYEVNVPRRENKIGKGHTGFNVEFDPSMTPLEAARRRDFTMNSLAMTPDGRVLDPFGGSDDIEAGIMRATSEAFMEDPLRVLRGMQFAGRFGFKLDAPTIEMCKQIIDQFGELSKERVYGEWWKWASMSRTPSKGLELLVQTGWIKHFPWIANLIDVQQDPIWHPEGNGFLHTAHVTDAAAMIARREDMNDSDRGEFVLAALCHDFGKVTTSQIIDNRWRAPGHDAAGVPLSDEFLKSINTPPDRISRILPLVAEHMCHIMVKPSPRVIRRLATRLYPATVQMWSWIVESDYSGRPPLPPGNPTTSWIELAKSMDLALNKPKPTVMGRHLLEIGYKPGPEMGKVLKAAFEAELDGLFSTLEGGLQWIKDHRTLVA